MVSLVGYPRSGVHRLCYNVYSMLTGRPVRLEECGRQLFPKIATSDLLWENGFTKDHAMSSFLPEGERVVYTVRNPLDIVCSISSWWPDKTINGAIKMIVTSYSWSHSERGSREVGNWAEHVMSYLERPATLILKYEDYSNEQMSQMAKFLGLSWTPEMLEWNTKGHARAEELRVGAEMRHVGNGRVDKWREILSERQVDWVVGKLGEVMEVLSYQVT